MRAALAKAFPALAAPWSAAVRGASSATTTGLFGSTLPTGNAVAACPGDGTVDGDGPDLVAGPQEATENASAAAKNRPGVIRRERSMATSHSLLAAPILYRKT
jgi:hypothetical protein